MSDDTVVSTTDLAEPANEAAELTAPKKRGRPRKDPNAPPKPKREPAAPREKKDPALRRSEAVAGALTPGEVERVRDCVMRNPALGTVSELVRTAVLGFADAWLSANPVLPGTERTAALLTQESALETLRNIN